MAPGKTALGTLSPELLVSKRCLHFLPLLLLKLQSVRDHSNKLTVCRFSFRITDGIPEVLLQGLDITAIPGYLDRVPDGAPTREAVVPNR